MREDIAKWVEALRSGEYKQCKGALEYNGGYCCLGVYAKINNIKYEPAVESLGASFGVQEYNSYAYEKLRRKIPQEIVDSGIAMNDKGMYFSQIADMIEKYYAGEEPDE